MDENITPDALPGDAQLTPPDATGTVEKPIEPAPSDPNQMTLSELNAFLGKNFKNKDDALRSVKETFSYVGKKKEDIERDVLARISQDDKTNAIAKEVENMRKDMFYKDNPQFVPYRNVIEKVGGNPAEVVASEGFKDLFAKAQGFDESQKLKTVLESNPRLASTKDAFSKAKELQKQGAPTDQVESLVVRGVLDALEK